MPLEPACQVSTPPLVEQVVEPNEPRQTWKLVTAGRNTVRVAVALTFCELAVMVAVPAATPEIVALPHRFPLAHAPVIVAVVGSLVDHDTPVVKVFPWLLLFTA